MTHAPATQDPSGDYDPDSSEPQPPGSLAALIGRVLAEMDALQFASFSKDDALDLGLLLVELGRQRSLPIAVDITKGEQVLFHAALDGATPDNERWINAKKRTALRYEVPSLLVGLRARAAGGRIEDNAWWDQWNSPPTAERSPFTCAAWAPSPSSPSPACPRRRTTTSWSRPCGWS